MKIAIVSHYFESHRGGIEIVAGGLMRALARLGHKIVWLACDATPPPAAADNCTAIAVPATNLLEDRIGLPVPIPTPAGVVHLLRCVQQADCVLMHDAFYPTSLVAFLAARLWRKPIVIAAHARPAAVPQHNHWLHLAIRLVENLVARPLMARADGLAFVGEMTATYFATVRFRAPPAVIFNGVDTDVFRTAADYAARAALRTRLDLPPDRAVVLFVGRFVPLKGLHLLQRMAQRRPDILWALAGWGLIDPNAWGLKNVRVFSGLSGASLAPLYQASDVFVLPSVGEGYPLVIQEALACGLPVVCGDETARADPAARAFLTPVAMNFDDPDAIATDFCAAIDGLLADSGDRVAMAAARFRFAAERYSWDACATQYATLLEAAKARWVGKRRIAAAGCDVLPSVSASRSAARIERCQR